MGLSQRHIIQTKKGVHYSVLHNFEDAAKLKETTVDIIKKAVADGHLKTELGLGGIPVISGSQLAKWIPPVQDKLDAVARFLMKTQQALNESFTSEQDWDDLSLLERFWRSFVEEVEAIAYADIIVEPTGPDQIALVNKLCRQLVEFMYKRYIPGRDVERFTRSIFTQRVRVTGAQDKTFYDRALPMLVNSGLVHTYFGTSTPSARRSADQYYLNTERLEDILAYINNNDAREGKAYPPGIAEMEEELARTGGLASLGIPPPSVSVAPVATRSVAPVVGSYVPPLPPAPIYVPPVPPASAVPVGAPGPAAAPHAIAHAAIQTALGATPRAGLLTDEEETLPISQRRRLMLTRWRLNPQQLPAAPHLLAIVNANRQDWDDFYCDHGFDLLPTRPADIPLPPGLAEKEAAERKASVPQAPAPPPFDAPMNGKPGVITGYPVGQDGTLHVQFYGRQGTLTTLDRVHLEGFIDTCKQMYMDYAMEQQVLQTLVMAEAQMQAYRKAMGVTAQPAPRVEQWPAGKVDAVLVAQPMPLSGGDRTLTFDRLAQQEVAPPAVSAQPAQDAGAAALAALIEEEMAAMNAPVAVPDETLAPANDGLPVIVREPEQVLADISADAPIPATLEEIRAEVEREVEEDWARPRPQPLTTAEPIEIVRQPEPVRAGGWRSVTEDVPIEVNPDDYVPPLDNESPIEEATAVVTNAVEGQVGYVDALTDTERAAQAALQKHAKLTVDDVPEQLIWMMPPPLPPLQSPAPQQAEERLDVLPAPAESDARLDAAPPLLPTMVLPDMSGPDTTPVLDLLNNSALLDGFKYDDDVPAGVPGSELSRFWQIPAPIDRVLPEQVTVPADWQAQRDEFGRLLNNPFKNCCDPATGEPIQSESEAYDDYCHRLWAYEEWMGVVN